MIALPPDPRIAEALRTYLATRPKAIDTTQGIRNWWLADLKPPPETVEVERALRFLEAAGEVESLPFIGGAVLWSAARPKR